MLRGAYILLMLGGGLVLIRHKDSSNENRRPHFHPSSISVGAMLLWGVLLLCVWTAMEFADLHRVVFNEMLFALFLSLTPPFLILTGYTLRYSKFPSKKSFLFFLYPLLLPITYIFTGWMWLFWIMVCYFVVVIGFIIFKHHNWEREHQRFIKDYYSDLDNRSTDWLYKILIPIVFQMLLLWICKLVNTYLIYDVFYLYSILICGTMVFFSYRHRESEIAIDASDDAKSGGEKTTRPISPETLLLIEEGLKRTEEELLFLQNDIDAQTYTKAIGTNRTYFSRYLHNEKGMNFYQYINHLRMSHAYSLLCESDMTVDDISFSCGYNDPGTFRHIFKDHFGCTPSELRASAKFQN